MSAADIEPEIEVEEKGKVPFRRYFYRGYEVHKLLDLTHAELLKLLHARARRHLTRGSISRQSAKLLKRLRIAKREAPENEKPETIKTHLRNQIVLPEMVGNVVGVYNGKNFLQVEIKPDMVGHYLGEFSITYQPCKHGGKSNLSAASKIAK